MPAKFGAGQMVESVAFDQRGVVDDGYGNSVSGDWAEQFKARAKFVPLKASETVMAGRLDNRETKIVQIYASTAARGIGVDWRCRDTRRGTVYNIRDVQEDRTRQLVDVLVESNVNPG